MMFRLGHLPLRPDPQPLPFSLILRLGREISKAETRAIGERALTPGERMFRLMEQQQREQTRLHFEALHAPDLLCALEADDPERAWVAELYASVRGLDDGQRRLQLVACERVDPGSNGSAGLGLSILDRALMAEVRPRDELCAGFAARRDEDGGLLVQPRIYRKVCANGASVPARLGQDVLAECGSVGEAVRTCLGRPMFAASCERLSRAAQAQVADPLPLLRLAGLGWQAAEIVAAREEHDDSVYGWMNALTALARREPAFLGRARIEARADRLLAAGEGALLRRGQPERRARAPLQIA